MTLSRWRHATKRLARRAVALDGGAEDVADTERDHLVAMAWFVVTENLTAAGALVWLCKTNS